MNYRSYADLSKHIAQKIWQIPKDVDIVVGIPRSGMLPANMIALHRNLPFTDLEGLKENRILRNGTTRKITKDIQNIAEAKHILIIDDSVLSGNSIIEAKKYIAGQLPENIKISWAAIYVTAESQKHVDFFFNICPEPRIFEWNIFHHKILSNACVDIDGVLCLDPLPHENDDATNYISFLQNAKPLYQTNIKIKHLITNRLEKYRPQTEKWLNDHNIDFEKLSMCQCSTAEERRQKNEYGKNKANLFIKDTASLFIESETRQAKEIAEISGKPVLCIENHKIYMPGYLNKEKIKQKIKQKILNKIMRIKEKIINYSKKKI